MVRSEKIRNRKSDFSIIFMRNLTILFVFPGQGSESRTSGCYAAFAVVLAFIVVVQVTKVISSVQIQLLTFWTVYEKRMHIMNDDLESYCCRTKVRNIEIYKTNPEFMGFMTCTKNECTI